MAAHEVILETAREAALDLTPSQSHDLSILPARLHVPLRPSQRP